MSNQNIYDPSQTRQSQSHNQSNQFQNQALSPNSYTNGLRQSTETYSQDSPGLRQTTGTRNGEENNNNFKVVVRVRPPLERELESGQLVSTVQLTQDRKRISIYEYYNIEAIDPENVSEYLENNNMYTTHSFTFDRVYDPSSSQSEVYEHTAKPAVMSVLQGYNATILAYGQTGTGKTFTMEGFKFNSQDTQRGIVPRSMEEIFKYIENVSNARTTFMVRVSYLQIYNEVVSDLLRTDRTNLHIREDKKKGVFVEGLSEWAVRSPHEIYALIQKGALSRATAATRMNDMSSRSHAVFIIIVEQMSKTIDEETGEELKEIRVGKLNLVDLAGSERVRVTGATGKRLEECKKINQSLSALGNVISALADQKQSKTHIPYRDSKITRLLEDSLGGNCITTMMAMISPTVDAFNESLSTLKFANRAKNIKNAPIINEDADQKALLRKYEAELKKLREELDEKNKVFSDKKRVTQLEEDKKKAEQDKVAAFAMLEARSKEFVQEREEKKKLEEKIGAMYSQMLQGGKKIEDTPQFRNALEEHQQIIRKQYEQRLGDLEKERQLIEEDKAQVDRYKQLLLKQRDIMIALTTRLNERDDTIIQLQEELEAYDRIHRETEEVLDVKDKRIHELEHTLRENHISIPKDKREDLDLQNPILRTLSEAHQFRNTSPDLIEEQSRYVNTQNDRTITENDSPAKKAPMSNETEIQIRKAIEKVKKSEEEQTKLKEIIRRKDEQIKALQQESNPRTESLWNLQRDIKNNVDSIIESLSSQNEPQRLQDVARDLLNLQKLVNSIPLRPSSDNQQEDVTPTRNVASSASDISSKKSQKTTESQRVETKSYNAIDSKHDQRSPTMHNRNNESNGHSNQNGRHINTKSVSDETSKSAPQSKENTDSKAKSPTMPSPKMKGESKRSAENKLAETKKNISTGIFGKYMGSLVNVDPERKPMTVEEMLKMKRDQPEKRK